MFKIVFEINGGKCCCALVPYFSFKEKKGMEGWHELYYQDIFTEGLKSKMRKCLVKSLVVDGVMVLE